MPETKFPSVADEALVETDEDGFHLVLVGDFADACADYLAADPATPSSSRLRVRLSQDAALQLTGQVRVTVGPWADEYDAALAEYRRAPEAVRRAVIAGATLGRAPAAVFADELADVSTEALLEAGDNARKAARERA